MKLSLVPILVYVFTAKVGQLPSKRRVPFTPGMPRNSSPNFSLSRDCSTLVSIRVQPEICIYHQMWTKDVCGRAGEAKRVAGARARVAARRRDTRAAQLTEHLGIQHVIVIDGEPRE